MSDKGEQMSSILDDAREKIAIGLFKHEQGVMVADNKRLPPELSLGELHVSEWDRLDEPSREYWRTRADVALSASGTTDIECPECKSSGHLQHKPHKHSRYLNDCPHCDDGVIKYPWKVSVVLENGELPKLDWERLSTSNITNCGKTQRDMLNEGWVKKVRQVVE